MEAVLARLRARSSGLRGASFLAPPLPALFLALDFVAPLRALFAALLRRALPAPPFAAIFLAPDFSAHFLAPFEADFLAPPLETPFCPLARFGRPRSWTRWSCSWLLPSVWRSIRIAHGFTCCFFHAGDGGLSGFRHTLGSARDQVFGHFTLSWISTRSCRATLESWLIVDFAVKFFHVRELEKAPFSTADDASEYLARQQGLTRMDRRAARRFQIIAPSTRAMFSAIELHRLRRRSDFG